MLLSMFTTRFERRSCRSNLCTDWIVFIYFISKKYVASFEMLFVLIGLAGYTSIIYFCRKIRWMQWMFRFRVINEMCTTDFCILRWFPIRWIFTKIDNKFKVIY